MTLEHLLTMSSGLDADDSNEDSPGNEDRVAEGDNPNWWQLTLDLDMVREPGEKAVYASLQPNLIGAVMRTASARPLAELFHDLVAEPLQIKQYWLNLQPLGEPYMGGGARFLPRDFMKLGQLILNGGTWNGRRVVSAEWARRSTSPLVQIGIKKMSGYGYLWWIIEYPFQGKTIQAFYAAGNGGQIVMGIPALDLVVAIYGGNYADPIIFQIQKQLVPQYVLPAVVRN
jgi:CubicO group peptidase (beta-lactamase class C family)